ncbi:hydantoinase B/oxoprolinase family protein [Pseudonocardia sp. MCCB 268]|nr:hydantoinase B/oxoprolinase family protein [Pseudonocardia cytotoxica]
MFHEGRIASFIALWAHQLDVGGVGTPGGSRPSKNIYEDGPVDQPAVSSTGPGSQVREMFSPRFFDNVRMAEMMP